MKGARQVDDVAGDALGDSASGAREYFGRLELPESADRLVAALVALHRDVAAVVDSHESALLAAFSDVGEPGETDRASSGEASS